MRMQTAESGSTKTIGNQANWIGTNQAMLVADQVMQKLQLLVVPGAVVSIGGLYKLVLEQFDMTMGIP